MKRVFFILIVACLLISLLNAADKVKVRQEVQVNNRDPHASNHSHGVPPTEDLFDWQFEWPLGGGFGEAGIECDGNYIYTANWGSVGSGVFYRYELDGTYIEQFTIAGISGGIRDLAYDGQYFYGAAATNTVYEMDFDAQTVISTITAPIAVRAIAYDPLNDGFWANNWSDQITLFDRNGNTLDSFPCQTFSSFFGFAWENVLDGGPYLWGYCQDGPTLNQLVQFDIATGLETGVNFDIGSIFNVGTGFAGGLCISDAFVPFTWTICGISQNVIIWGLELEDYYCPAPGAPTDFSVIPDTGGALEATIAWTCPTTQVNGDPLTDLDEMRVYRDDVLIYTDNAPRIGEPGLYVDSAVPASGLYTYKAVGFNDFGEGIPAAATTWVGEDVPNVVDNLLLVYQGGNGYLTWDNPNTGLNGGAFNEPILGYHIERSDGVIFEVTGIQTDYLDTTIPAPDYYNYTVTPYNLIGDGGSETSNNEWLGSPFDPPENVQVDEYTGLLTWIPPNEIIIEDYFESYNVGEYLAVQSDYWTTWSGTAGGADDALVSDDQALSGTKSVIVEGLSDIVLIMDNYTSGCYSMELYMYIVSGNGAYFNLQKTNTPGEEWAIEIYFWPDGEAWIYAGSCAFYAFLFNFDEWLNFEIIADLDNDLGELWFNGTQLHTWQWSLDSTGIPGLLSLGGLNLYAYGGISYYDDINFSIINAEPSDELTGYNIYLDDMNNPIDYTTDLEYQLTGLVYYQDYVAGVSAVYDDPGESDIIVYPFIYQGPNIGNNVQIWETELMQNYPNPFNKITTIRYFLPKYTEVKIQIYNLKGQLVEILVDDGKPAGSHTVEWNAKDMSSGIYFYKLITEDKITIKRVVVLR